MPKDEAMELFRSKEGEELEVMLNILAIPREYYEVCALLRDVLKEKKGHKKMRAIVARIFYILEVPNCT